MNALAKRLRADTGYPWQDCVGAAARTDDYAWAREMLPVIYRQRKESAEKQAMSDLIKAIQVAVVEAINTLGVNLLGSNFKPIASSPIPDDEVAKIIARLQPEPDSG